jgi:chemotaxis protein methyltransferase WspC
VIVPETWFFRYPESFATLAKLASKRLAEINNLRALRILSLPCSTGEEPYSIAMALLDAGLQPHQFKVEGMDVSPLSVERPGVRCMARTRFAVRIWPSATGISPQNDGFASVTGCGPGAPAGRQRARSGVARQRAAYDFVFCRNLLIYFDQPTQQQVFEVLKRLTHVDGVLFIGPAEGSLLGRLGMRSIGMPQSFAFSRHKANLNRRWPLPASLPAPLPVPRRCATWCPRPCARRSRLSPVPVAKSRRRCGDLAGEHRLAGQRRQKRRGPCRVRKLPAQSRAGGPGVLLARAAQRCGGQCLEAQGFYRKALYLNRSIPPR